MCNCPVAQPALQWAMSFMGRIPPPKTPAEAAERARLAHERQEQDEREREVRRKAGTMDALDRFHYACEWPNALVLRKRVFA